MCQSGRDGEDNSSAPVGNRNPVVQILVFSRRNSDMTDRLEGQSSGVLAVASVARKTVARNPSTFEVGSVNQFGGAEGQTHVKCSKTKCLNNIAEAFPQLQIYVQYIEEAAGCM
jgi:hypothetical protein